MSIGLPPTPRSYQQGFELAFAWKGTAIKQLDVHEMTQKTLKELMALHIDSWCTEFKYFHRGFLENGPGGAKYNTDIFFDFVENYTNIYSEKLRELFLKHFFDCSIGKCSAISEDDRTLWRSSSKSQEDELQKQKRPSCIVM
jgi:hypothetical protein